MPRMMALGLTAILAVVGCSDSSPREQVGAPGSTQPSPTTTSTFTTTTPDGSAPETELEPATVDDLVGIEGMIVLRDDQGNLAVVSPRGELIQQIASGDVTRHNQPTWSNDASQVAWSTISADGATIEIAELDGAPSRSTMLATPPFFLSWSPDDTWLGALRPVSNTIEFLIAETATTTARAVGAAQPFYFDWQTDDAVVAAVNGTTLVAIPAESASEPSQYSIPSPLGLFQAPSVIDAERIVVALARPEGNDVVLLGGEVDEKTLARADAGVTLSLNPATNQLAVGVADTAPQSQVIAFQTSDVPQLANGRVSIIDLDAGDVETIELERIVAMQWSPDGATLAMLQAIDGPQSTDGEFRWLLRSVDGAVIATTSFVPSSELATSYIPFADQYNHASTWWSPDSVALVISGSVNGEAGIWVDRVDDERGAVRISAGDIAVWSPR